MATATRLFDAAKKKQRLRALICDDSEECAARAHGAQHIAGVDEVGRGCVLPVRDIRM